MFKVYIMFNQKLNQNHAENVGQTDPIDNEKCLILQATSTSLI